MTVSDIQTEATEGAALVTALEERVLSGDTTVDPDELANARKLAEFASMRVAGAGRQQYEAEKAEAAEETQAAADRAKAVTAGPHKDIDALRAKATKAIDAYFTAIEQRYVEARRAARELHLAIEKAATHDLPHSWEAHGIENHPDYMRVRSDRGSEQRYNWLTFVASHQAVESVITLAGLHPQRAAPSPRAARSTSRADRANSDAHLCLGPGVSRDHPADASRGLCPSRVADAAVSGVVKVQVVVGLHAFAAEVTGLAACVAEHCGPGALLGASVAKLCCRTATVPRPPPAASAGMVCLRGCRSSLTRPGSSASDEESDCCPVVVRHSAPRRRGRRGVC